ncbi:MAG: Ig-like domain-containing protein [Burkholderiales bacterium]|nr:Ig-like domain-containing protein [Burkholderiales bacterium]
MRSTPSNHHPQRSVLREAARWLGLAAVAFAGLATLVGSGGGGGGGDTPPALSVIGTTPTNGATGVAINSTVSATFAENLANTPTLTVAGGAGTVAGTVVRAGATVTFTPAAALAFSTTYTASVSGASGAGGGTQSGTTTWTFTTLADPNAPPGQVTISGTADFESVPNDTSSNGRLLYANVGNRVIRGATVQVVAAAGGAVLASGTTSATGTYSLTIPAAQSVIVRVRAEMLKSAGAGGTWNFTVRDNTQGDAVYALDSPAFTPTAGANTRNLRATSGWGGASYTTTRVAGPFAVLDVAYDAVQKILGASANQAFPALQLMWSVNNRPVSGNLATGSIGTSFYTFGANGHRIYILGAADTDTDEYDRPVVAHEFGHYMQSAFSRDDSIGGPHGGGDKLDMRVAFSEGWGNAWSGMALATQYYTDSAGAGQQSGFRLDLAAQPPAGDRGWYSERSVQYLMYQWHQNASIGFTPIFNLLAALPTTLPADGALSSIHQFAYRLKLAVPGQAAAIDTLLSSVSITVTGPIGAGETNSGGIADAIPVYRTHTAAIGVAQNYCLNDSAGGGSDESNKLAAHVFIRFTLGAAGTRTISAVTTTGGVTSDPDFRLYRSDGTQQDFETDANNVETTPAITLPAGTHIIALDDFNLTRGSNAATNNGQRCFDVTIN